MNKAPAPILADVLKERVIPALARYRWPAVAAYYVRKAADQQLRRRFVSSYDRTSNGEWWLLDTVGPSVRRAFDIGANEGQWTAALLDRSPQIEHVVCWEPGATAFARLRACLGENPRVELVQAAVSDRAELEAEFFESDGTQDSSMFATAAGDSHATIIPVVQLDEEIERLGAEVVDLVKIDAEGADLMVLRGARRSLQSQRIRLVQFEYHRPWLHAGATMHAALEFLAACGYDTYLLNGSGLCRFDRNRAPEIFHYMNFVAVAQSHRDFVAFDVQPDPLWG